MYSWNRERNVLSAYSYKFLGAPWAGGVVLLVCVAIAMLLANLPLTAEIYHNLLHTNLSLNIGYGDHQIIFPKEMTLEKAINDGLM
ncbi:MAG: Na+/H+ antiporter NhaA, partial [Alistipes sp.]|nr:Na+/H+ antiporter NhaA [Alistipes sp.]